jgi:excinuclease UvrABC ATPase subunit
MSEYLAYFTTTASVAVRIDADSPEEAQEKADDFNDFPGLCAHCSGWGQRLGIELSDVWEQDGEVEAT